MSAWMVSHTHINALLTAWVELSRRDPYGSVETETDDVTAVGKLLLAENVKSLNYRYEDRHPDMYNVDPTDDDFVFSPLPGFDPENPSHLGVVAKSINCYRYQTCEHPTWESSDAYKWCEELYDDLLRALPGYDKAPWGTDDPNVFQGVN